MKKTLKIILTGIIITITVWGSFYTENLAQRRKYLMIKQYNPEQIVEMMFRDSLNQLSKRAIPLGTLRDGIASDHNLFAQNHARTFGIGGPNYYVVSVDLRDVLYKNHRLKSTIDGVEIIVPLKHIFGNTAREASGWFDIDEFKNSMEFNAVSAAMNQYILANSLSSLPTFYEGENLNYLFHLVGAVSIEPHKSEIHALTIIPYILECVPMDQQ